MALGGAPGGLPPIGAQAVLYGMDQFNRSVRQVSTGLGQINGASLAMERNSTLATTRMISAFASMSSAYVVGGSRMAATLGVATAGIAGFAIAAVAAGAQALVSAAAFEKALTPVRVYGDLTIKQTAQLSDNVLDMSRKWGVATGSIAEGATALVKAGASAEQMNSTLLEAVTLLSVASQGELDMAAAADIVTQGMRSWKLPVSEAITFVNALVGATNASTVGFRGMVAGLGQSQAMAASVGISYRELFATLGILNDENIRGERAGTAYRNLLIRMLAPTKDVAGIMLRYGISLSDANGNMVGARVFTERLTKAFSDEAVALRGMTKAQVEADVAALGMSRSLLGALAIANQGTEAIDRYDRAMDKLDVRKINEAINANTVAQARIFAQNISAIATVFGGPFNEALRRTITNMNKWLQSIGSNQINVVATAIRDTLGGAVSTGVRILSEFFKMLGERAPAVGLVANAIFKLGDSIARVFSGAGNTLSDFGIHISNAVKSLDIILTVMGVLGTAAAKAFNMLNLSANTTSKAVDLTTQDIQGAVQFIVNAIADFVAGVMTAGRVVGEVFEHLAKTFGFNASEIAKDIDVSGANLDIYAMSWSDVGKAVAKFLMTLYVNVRDSSIAINKFVVDSLRAFSAMVEEMKPLADRVIDFYVDIYDASRFYGKKTTDSTFDTWDVFAEGLRVAIQLAYKLAQAMAFIEQSSLFRPTGKEDFWAKALVNLEATVKSWPSDIERATAASRKALDDGLEGVGRPDRSKMKKNFDDTALALQDSLIRISNLVVAGTVQGVAVADEIVAKVRDTIGRIPSYFAANQIDVRKFFDEAMVAAKEGVPAIDAWIAKFREAMSVAEQADAERARGVGDISFGPSRGSAAPDTEGVGYGVDQVELMRRHVAGLLKELPALTDEFTKFIAELAVADPNRLAGMVDALLSQKALLQDIGKIRLEILQTDIKIAEVDERLAGIARQQQRIQLEMQKAMLPFEQQLLGLRERSLRIEAQMMPIQNAIADIDRQIALVQRENLELRMRELVIRQQMLPIEQAIEDIDKRIADTQRVNYEWAIQIAEIQLRMLPVQQAIEDLEQQKARNSRENYELVRQLLQLEQQALPARRAIEDIDASIAKLQRENYEAMKDQLDVQGRMLPLQAQLAAIDYEMANAARTNYELNRQIADAEKQALPFKQQMLLLEQQITALIDKRAQLERDRMSLIAEHELRSAERSIKSIGTQLDQLWAKFGTTKGIERSSLIPQIIDLEKQKKDLEDTLKPAQALVDSLNDVQAEIDFNNKLAEIGLRLQAAEQEALLAPINAHIAALKAQQEQEQALAAASRARLEEQRDGIEAILRPMARELELLMEIQERDRQRSDVAVNALLLEKQRWQDILLTQEDAIMIMRRLQEDQKLAADIANARIDEQLDLQRQVLEKYEAELTVIQRLQQAQDLRSSIARLGLEQEKARLETLLRVWQDQLSVVERERAAQDLRNQIVITGLEQQKRGLEDLLRPLEDVRISIERQTAAITNQQEQVRIAYDKQLLSLRAVELENLLYKNQLETIRAAEEKRLGDLIKKFEDALKASGAFSTGEITESTKRLGLWQGEVNKLAELKTAYANLTTALGITTAYTTAKGSIDTLTTAFGGASTASNNLRAALTDNNQLKPAFDSVATSITSAAGALNNTGNTGFVQLVIAAYAHIPHAVTAVNNLKDAFLLLYPAITNVNSAMQTYGIVAAKNIATEAIAAALGQSLFDTYRQQTGSLGMGAQKAYDHLLSLLQNKQFGYASGGMVPGAPDQPQLAVVHGGEYVVSRPELHELTAAMSRAMTTYNQQQTNINYTFSANYEKQQDPITASMDMRAVIEMTR